jgi:hypothetical protein
MGLKLKEQAHQPGRVSQTVKNLKNVSMARLIMRTLATQWSVGMENGLK